MNVVRIPFSDTVNIFTFEHLLKQFYSYSNQESTSEVVFDFSAVEWCEPFQLSLLLLWISELLKNDKRVVFLPPSQSALPKEETLSKEEREKRIGRRIVVYSYLVEYLFIDFLIKNKVLSENNIKGYQSKRRAKPIESRI